MTTLRLSTLGIALLTHSASAGASDVVVQLDAATIERCGPCTGWYCYGSIDCYPPVARELAPLLPQGNGTIDFDTSGVLIGGSLSLEAHQQDGFAIPGWSRALARRDPQLHAGFLAFTGWGDGELAVTSFTNQSAFAGRITNTYSVSTGPDTEDRIVETYSFRALPGGSAPVCAGQRLHFDEDGDGQEDARDRARFGFTDTSSGSSVDGAGRTIADYCGAGPFVVGACRRGDFRNDEPRSKHPRDCTLIGTCLPDAFQPPASPAPFAGPTCQGLPVFADADLDGEGDGSDRCASTPAGAAIDEDGCSAAQFCALQPVVSCKRVDFRNDEPLRKKPHDCRRAQNACEVAP